VQRLGFPLKQTAAEISARIGYRPDGGRGH
jgi:hypothetical protein